MATYDVPGRILLIEDDTASRRMRAEQLERTGHAVIGAEDGRVCEDTAVCARVALVVTGVPMPAAVRFGADRVIYKPFRPSALLAVVQELQAA